MPYCRWNKVFDQGGASSIGAEGANDEAVTTTANSMTYQGEGGASPGMGPGAYTTPVIQSFNVRASQLGLIPDGVEASGGSLVAYTSNACAGAFPFSVDGSVHSGMLPTVSGGSGEAGQLGRPLLLEGLQSSAEGAGPLLLAGQADPGSQRIAAGLAMLDPKSYSGGGFLLASGAQLSIPQTDQAYELELSASGMLEIAPTLILSGVGAAVGVAAESTLLICSGQQPVLGPAVGGILRKESGVGDLQAGYPHAERLSGVGATVSWNLQEPDAEVSPSQRSSGVGVKGEGSGGGSQLDSPAFKRSPSVTWNLGPLAIGTATESDTVGTAWWGPLSPSTMSGNLSGMAKSSPRSSIRKRDSLVGVPGSGGGSPTSGRPSGILRSKSLSLPSEGPSLQLDPLSNHGGISSRLQETFETTAEAAASALGGDHRLGVSTRTSVTAVNSSSAGGGRPGWIRPLQTDGPGTPGSPSSPHSASAAYGPASALLAGGINSGEGAVMLHAKPSPTPGEGAQTFQHMVGKLSKAGVGGISFSISTRQAGVTRPAAGGPGGERPGKHIMSSNVGTLPSSPGSPRNRGPSVFAEPWSAQGPGPGPSTGVVGGLRNSVVNSSFTSSTSTNPTMAGTRRGPASYFSRGQGMSVQGGSLEPDQRGAPLPWAAPAQTWSPAAQQQIYLQQLQQQQQQVLSQQQQVQRHDTQQLQPQQQQGSGDNGQPLAEGQEQPENAAQQHLQYLAPSEPSSSDPGDPSSNPGEYLLCVHLGAECIKLILQYGSFMVVSIA